MAVAGWMNQQQLQLIDYLREENRVLREQLGEKRLRFNDDQRRRLAARAKDLGSKALREVATIVTPETLLAWHRRLIVQKYDGSGKRGCARPRKSAEIEDLVQLDHYAILQGGNVDVGGFLFHQGFFGNVDLGPVNVGERVRVELVWDKPNHRFVVRLFRPP